MKLVIVSGLSGAGKTIALHSLEDMGAYCVDNLPVSLLPSFAEHSKKLEMTHECTAVGIDARTANVQEVTELLRTLSHLSMPYEVLFLEANDEILIKRFSETRRRHPLTSAQVPLVEAIHHERKLLKPLANLANVRINTSQLHIHQLRDTIRLCIRLNPMHGLSLLFQSFGYKFGIPNDVDFVFDVRCLPNPHWQAELRPLTGRDSAVIHFLESQPQVQQMLEQLIRFLEVLVPQFAAENRNYLTIAIGCTGGQHRSLYIAEQLARHFSQQHEGVLVRHRELP
jgi:UPF0042 nucleotide-binding protein